MHKRIVTGIFALLSGMIVTLSVYGQGDAYLMLGNNAFEKKEYLRAVEHYNKCLESNPKHTGCLFNRGLARMIAVSYASALEDFTAIISLQPTHVKAFEHRGNCYASMGREEEAFKDFSRAIEINPRSVGAYLFRGGLYKKKKDLPRAFADYSKMIEVAPNDGRGYEYRGDIYRELKEFDKALSDYTQAIQLNPNNGSALYYRGEIYFEQGKTALAEADFNRAIAIDKMYEGWVRTLKTLAESRRVLKQLEKKPDDRPAPEQPNVYGLWNATLQFGTASKSYGLFFEPNNVQSPSALFVVNGERYEFKSLKILATGEIRFDLTMGKTQVFFTGVFDSSGQKINGQFTYTYQGKTTTEMWSAQR